MSDINDIWRRIEWHQGEEFHTITGKHFAYEVHENIFWSSRAKQNISRANFERALAFVPFDGPGHVNQMVRSPAYISAVLHDPRIRQEDY